MEEADLTEALVGRNLIAEQLSVTPAQSLAPEIAAFRASVFSPKPFPIEINRAKSALMGQLQLAVQLGHRCGASAEASEDADVHGGF